MEISKTDVNKIITLLTQSASFFKAHAKSTRDIDKERQINNMIKKLKKKFK